MMATKAKHNFWLLVGPILLLYLLLFIVPFGILCVYSFLRYIPGSLNLVHTFTLENYLRFFQDAYYGQVLVRTVLISIIVTLISLIMAYPLAYFMAHSSSYTKTVLLVLVTLPLISGVIVQTLGWYCILARYGPVNNCLKALGLISNPINILGNEIGVTFGLIQGFLPFMVLPLMNSIQAIPASLHEAAESLGASKVMSFFRVTLPLSMNGILAGSLLVFCACLSSFTTPSVLGQGKVHVIGTIIYQQAIQLFNWPFASVLAIILLAGLFLLALASRWLSVIGKRGRNVHSWACLITGSQ